MVALFLTIDFIEIGRLKLNLNEYLTLMKFQHDIEERTFPFVPDERFFERLLKDEFITKKEDGNYTLGLAGIRVFKDGDLFEEFYALFPNKVPTGMGFRPVSTNDPNGISAKTTRTIWEKVTKNKPYLQKTIIENLKRELEHRKADGSLAFLQNIDTWLRQATWEKWDDIPDKKNTNNYIKL